MLHPLLLHCLLTMDFRKERSVFAHGLTALFDNVSRDRGLKWQSFLLLTRAYSAVTSHQKTKQRRLSRLPFRRWSRSTKKRLFSLDSCCALTSKCNRFVTHNIFCLAQKYPNPNTKRLAVWVRVILDILTTHRIEELKILVYLLPEKIT